MKLDLDRQEKGRSELRIEGSVDLGLSDGRPAAAALTGTLKVDNLDLRFLVTGELRAVGQAECGRCLRDFTLTWPVPVELMVLRDLETDEGEGDTLVIRQMSGEVDLAEPLRESAVLAFPLAPVCSEDCRGLCPGCGCDLNAASCDCAEEETDPRWDGLP